MSIIFVFIFQCVIDLRLNRLEIGTNQTVTSFLGEGDLPDHARLNAPVQSSQDEDQQLAEALSKSAQEAGNYNNLLLLMLRFCYIYADGKLRLPG